jgi:hypothetical protein
MTAPQLQFYMPLLHVTPGGEWSCVLPAGALKLRSAGDHKTGALQVLAGVTSHVNNWGWQCKARGTAINTSRYFPQKNPIKTEQ